MVQNHQYDILHSIQDGALIIDQEYTILFVNQRVSDLYGVPQEKLIGKKCFDVLHYCLVPCTKENIPESQCGHRQVFATGRPVTVTHKHIFPGNEIKVHEISISPLTDEAGNIDRVLHQMRDISELNTVFNNAPFTIAYLDTAMRVLKINRSMEKLIGRKNDEVEGRFCYEVWGQHAGAATKKGKEKICDSCKVTDALADRKIHRYERKVGDRYIEVTASPVKDANGLIIGAMESGQDITERKKAEEQLYTYGRILSATHDLMSFIDRQYTYQAVNDAYCRYHKQKQEDIVGKTAAELMGDAVFEQVVKEGMDRALTGELVHYEDWFDYPEKGHRFMNVTYIPYHDQNKLITGVVVVVRDHTDRKKSEEALLKSESRYRYLFNNLNDAAFIIGEKGKFLEANAVAQKRFGYSREEFLQIRPKEINSKEFTGGVQERLAMIQQQGSLFFETVHVTRDGSPIATEISARRIQFKNQSCTLALARDISDRKKAEEALRASETLFRELFDSMSSGVIIYEATEDGNEFIIRDINPAALKSTQVERDKALDKNVRDVFPSVEEIGLLRVFQEVHKSGKPIHYPATVYNDARLNVWVENFVCKLPTGEIVAIYDDITERKEAELALARSQEEWERTFDSFTDIVTLQTPSMEIVKINQAGCQIFGMEKEDLLTQHCFEFFHGSKVPCEGCPLLETQKDFQAYTKEMYHAKLDKTFLVSAAPVLNKDGELEYIAHVAKDITEIKRLEKELAQAQKMEAVGTLAGGIAHDFNNILSAIIGYAELIKYDEASNSSTRKDVAEIIGAGKRAADLVKQILTFSRKTTIEKRPLQPHLIVKEALKMLRASLPTTIHLQENIDYDCGSILIDPTNLHQVVVNLCTNARQAMPKEKGTLSVDLQLRDVKAEELSSENGFSPGPFVVFSVRDTGTGMDTVTLERIFEPYFTTKEVGSGTGLGLAVTHGIVQNAGGFTRVTSALGQGTTFDIYFPALQEQGAVDTDSKDKGRDLLRGKEHLLVVDDEPFLVRVTQRQLESQGYTVTTTSESKDALEKIQAHPEQFDLLITDQTMPGLTGVELTLAAREVRPDLPVILCTGHSQVISRKEALEMGIEEFVDKPISCNTLFSAVRSVLDRKK